MPTCPKCNSTNLRRSHTRGLRERLLKPLGWRAFRCREKTCRWRGLLKMESPSLKLWEYLKSKKVMLLALATALCVIGVFTGILLYLIH